MWPRPDVVIVTPMPIDNGGIITAPKRLARIAGSLYTAPTVAEFWMIADLVTKGVRAPGPTSWLPRRPERCRPSSSTRTGRPRSCA